ncbi:MAG: helix-turn-helix transcriptional regulator [Oscillospiraceae bacterium]|nr:helix-turn-helix transcriptional regulator [Oscillospiraceae bacterium]
MSFQLRDRTYYLTCNAGVSHNTQMHACKEHLHDFIEFVYIAKGKCVHTVDGNVYPLKKGDMLIINYGQTHSIIGGTGEYINIFLKPEYLNENIDNQCNVFAILDLAEFSEFKNSLAEIKNVVSFSEAERTTVENIIMNLETELHNKPRGYDLTTRSWYNLLLVMVFRKMSQLITERFSGISEELLIFIKSHCHEKLEMGSLAKNCHYNPAYFSRCFHAYTGISFTDYLKKVRLERAAQLLTDTTLSVQDVCYAVGYSDKTKFFRHFKTLYGQTPLHYRKKDTAQK